MGWLVSGTALDYKYSPDEVLMFVIAAAAFGLLGAAFNQGYKAVHPFRPTTKKGKVRQ
jgi:H+/Cl- antiporter ClcA